MKNFTVLTQQFTTRTFEVEATSVEEAEEQILAEQSVVFDDEPNRVGLVDTDLSEELVLTTVENKPLPSGCSELNNDILEVIDAFVQKNNDEKDMSFQVISIVLNKLANQYEVCDA